MGHEFRTPAEAEVDTTPEQVWAAIATGPGIDSWFMGRNEVDPGIGGAVRTAFGDYNPESAVTEWDPLKRLAYTSGVAPDGRFVAYEFLIEGQDSGSTVLRMVTSGFLPGDDWEAEYEAMNYGLAFFFRALREYLAWFAGRTASPVTVFGPPVADWEKTWAALADRLGLSGSISPGDTVRFVPDGLPPIEGVVYSVSPQCLGVRTGDTLYGFMQGLGGSMVAVHHVFAEIDRSSTEAAWRTWLDLLG
ncbi:MAG: hypothetical protein JWQ81_6636 [Amycolatopsis sp.]|uniref:SRPBCC family protein n=1 Tax=Amycolatopsis sp. TaxID=37632 RepID=UPI002614482D|nr:SRPBCC domain-containing protein [Amycolatopsis sp.]MCU1685897.1 hypothetical protein [Amycolatopsis sp.]